MSGDGAQPSVQHRPFRGDDAGRLVREITDRAVRIGRRIQFMEVCGTHTVSVFRSGIRALLPPNVRLISGPGCPVCVTSQAEIDAAIELAAAPERIVATYGDMLRVPGRSGSLERRRAAGGDVRVVSSARAALRLACENPDRQVIFLGVGFETTAPATARVVLEAERLGLRNFSVFASHKRVVPAMEALLDSGVRLDGFLCPGHVSVVIGSRAYRQIVERYGKPCVVAGFEPRQILAGLAALLRQVERGEARVENVYAAAVSEEGNASAVALLRTVFCETAAVWRGLGEIAASGLGFSPRYVRWDALRRFDVRPGVEQMDPACLCGSVLAGRAEPPDCALFARACTPLTPVGPCMVSSEGACAAWFRYGRHRCGKAPGARVS